MANKIMFTVGGIQYAVVSEDDEAYIKTIGRELDREMDKLAKQNPFLSTTMVAVLAAMDALDIAKKAEIQNAELSAQLKEMTEKYAVAHSNADLAERRLQQSDENNAKK